MAFKILSALAMIAAVVWMLRAVAADCGASFKDLAAWVGSRWPVATNLAYIGLLVVPCVVADAVRGRK